MIFFSFEKQHNVLFIERFHADLFHEVYSSSMFKNIIRVTEIGCCANVPGYAGCIKGSWEAEWTSGESYVPGPPPHPAVIAAESPLAGAVESKGGPPRRQKLLRLRSQRH